jgi:hypothetical protein
MLKWIGIVMMSFGLTMLIGLEILAYTVWKILLQDSAMKYGFNLLIMSCFIISIIGLFIWELGNEFFIAIKRRLENEK